MIFFNKYLDTITEYLLLLTIIILPLSSSEAQTRGIKIGYIDMEYILENVPDYIAAKNQLEEKAQKWKQEIEIRKNEIIKFKENLNSERPFLTKELIEEREDEVKFLERRLLDYQQIRFGPGGDLITQKENLIKPIQDQVFNIVQDIAESKKYDFIFDKSSDFTILFGAKKYDLSDRIVRIIIRTSKRVKVSKEKLKEIEEEEAKEDLENDNPILTEKKKIIEDKQAERKRISEERKKAFYEKREQLKQEKEAKNRVKQAENTSETRTP